MDYLYYLTSNRSEVYLKPESISLKNIPNKFIINEKDKPLISGIFVEFDEISKGKERYYGRRGEFCFVNKAEYSEYEDKEGKYKQDYIYKISIADIISIEIIFDEIAYSS